MVDMETLAKLVSEQFPFISTHWMEVLVVVLTVLITYSVTSCWRPAAGVGEEDIGPPPEDEEGETVPYSVPRLDATEMVRRSRHFYETMRTRRTVRAFSAEPVAREAVEQAVLAAGTSPSGAHTEPWTFVLVTAAPLKQQIRELVEREEEINYRRRMGRQWVDDLRRLQTDWCKPYLTTAPLLLLVFRHAYGVRPDGSRFTTYYNETSTGLACGLLIAALHHAGLATLTSTPLNCGQQLRRLLQRPEHEKLLLLLPVGRPAADCRVPQLTRKPLHKILVNM